jgi:hypothetical protein
LELVTITTVEIPGIFLSFLTAVLSSCALAATRRSAIAAQEAKNVLISALIE